MNPLFFASSKLIKKVVKLDDDTKCNFYIKEPSYSDAVSKIISGLTEGEDGSFAVARMIARRVCDENGNPIFTAERILGTDGLCGDDGEPLGALKESLTNDLLAAIGEVNGLGKSKKKPLKKSAKKKKSGAN